MSSSINKNTSSNIHLCLPSSQPSSSSEQVPSVGQNLHEVIQAGNAAQPSEKNWSERAVSYLNHSETKIDIKLPNFKFQEKLDGIGHEIERLFSPLIKFNQQLNSNGNGAWYSQLTTFLAKLPLRAARNIVQMLYNIIKAMTCSAVHPLKAITKLAKLIIILINELAKPENWSKMGAGMIGMSIGQAIATGNPFSVISLGIGTAMVIAGFTVGVLKSAISAEQGKLKAAAQNFIFQAKQLPESAMTGFIMGLIMGGIQRAMNKMPYVVSNPQEAQKFADQFIKDHNLPHYTNVELDPSGNIIISWEHHFANPGPDGLIATANKAELILQPNSSPIINGYGTWNEPNLPEVHFKWTYPSGPNTVAPHVYGPTGDVADLERPWYLAPTWKPVPDSLTDMYN